MTCPRCNDTGSDRYWEARWRDANAEIASLKAALKTIAMQPKTEEIEGDDGDFEGGFDAVIEVAREALHTYEQSGKGEQ